MVNRLIRTAFRLGFWLIADGGMIALNLGLITANYLACETSFELLGYEKRPLATDELLGPFFAAFLGNTTLAHFYAMTIVVVVASGLFYFFHVGFNTISLLEDRRTYLNRQDHESARAVLWLIMRELAVMLAFLIPLVFVMYWDMTLFRYRSIAGAMGITNPEVATLKMASWELQLQKHGDWFAWTTTNVGSWGYIAATVIACFGVEFVFSKTRECARLLLETFEEVLQPQENREASPDFYGYDQHGRTVYHPDAPIVYDTNGNPVVMQDRVEADISPEPGTPEYEANEAGTADQPPLEMAAVAQMRGQNDTTVEGLFDPAMARQNGKNHNQMTHAGAREVVSGSHRRPEPWAPEVSVPREGRARDLRRVIGSADGERVSMTTALGDPKRYWVDPETHEVWDVAFRIALLDGAPPEKPSVEKEDDDDTPQQ